MGNSDGMWLGHKIHAVCNYERGDLCVYMMPVLDISIKSKQEAAQTYL